MGKAKVNFIYNSLYQIFSIIVPIVLAPYLSRKLGVNGTGVYSYTYSIVYYFMLFIMLGINNYGSRVIAKNRNNKPILSKKFCEIYSVQLILGILITIVYGIFIYISQNEYRLMFIILGLFVLSSAIDINWFFYGLEEFKITVPRSFVIRIINFILIILLVNKAEDLWIYALIMSSTAFVNQLVLWPFLFSRINFVKFKFSQIKKHLKPLLVLFIPVIAVSLYKIMDKIMLGSLSTVSEVGLYEYAEKINSIPLVVISALGTVMLPRISSIIKDKQTVDIYLRKASEFALFMTVPLFFIFVLAAPTIVPLYLGENFTKTAYLAILLSFSLPFVSIANIIRTQYLIPAEKDKIYIVSVIIGALLNLLANFILIPFFGSLGACIGTIIAEISVMLYQTIKVRHELNIKSIIKNWLTIFSGSIIIFLICLPLYLIKIDRNIIVIIQLSIFSIVYAIFRYKYIFKLIKRKKRNV